MPPADSPPCVICRCGTPGVVAGVRGLALMAYAVECITAPDDVTALRELAREFYVGDDLARLEALLDAREKTLRAAPRHETVEAH